MPQRKIPQDALLYYIALGSSRSYDLVAKEFGVSKRAVVDHAVRERWQDRVAELERRARGNVNTGAADTVEAMNDRHLTLIKLMQSKAVEVLRNMPLAKAMDAIQTLNIAMRQEHLVFGEPSERTAVSVEDKVRLSWAMAWHDPLACPYILVSRHYVLELQCLAA